MADKTYSLNFSLSDGSTKSVRFTAPQGPAGSTPVRGTDYWTEVDKEEIVQEVLNVLGGAPFYGTIDENNVITVTTTLAEGTYILKYENADGTTTEIGQIVIGEGGSGYVNLADSTSSDWLTNKRINSSKNVVDVTEAQRGDQTVVVTNFISDVGVEKFHVKGLDILSNLVNGSSNQNYGRYYWYTSAKVLSVSGLQPSSSSYSKYFTTADYDNSVTIIDVAGLRTTNGYSDLSYMRLGGILTGAAEDVVITADENIQ